MMGHDLEDMEDSAISRRAALAGAAAVGAGALLGGAKVEALAAPARESAAQAQGGPAMNFVLSHEQFPVPDLVRCGVEAERSGFDGIWTSDHFQPWQPNEGHSGLA